MFTATDFNNNLGLLSAKAEGFVEVLCELCEKASPGE